MKAFRKKKKWLRYRVISQLKEKHTDLFDPWHKFWRKNFCNYISDSRRWWFVVAFVLFLFLISPFINISFLNFLKIDRLTATSIVDQRTANIATIISITLVVVGFILNNLAVKSALVYSFLFKKSFLYPIIYLTLSTIACFMLVSTLRDTISEYTFIRFVIAGTYIGIIILFFIGYLFRAVFLFSNDKYIAKIIDEELMIEATKNTKQILIIKHSREEYLALMKELGAKEYDWSEAWEDGNAKIEFKEFTHEEIVLQQASQKIIQDINLHKLAKIIFKKSAGEKIYYRNLNLEMSTGETNDFVWERKNPNTQQEKRRLKKTLILKPQPAKERDTYEMRKHFDQKLEELSEQSKHRNLETLLDTFTKLYEFQMLHQK